MKKIGIVGLGYVGYPLLIQVLTKFDNIVGFDINESRLSDLKTFHKGDTEHEFLTNSKKSKNLLFTSNPSELRDCNVKLICVPTPLSLSGEPDISHLVTALATVGNNMQKNDLVIIESTIWPGTSRDIGVPILESSSELKVGEDFFLAFSPERIDPGNDLFNLTNTPRIVSGYDKKSRSKANEFYSQFINHVILADSLIEAEMTKLFENSFRLVNISFVNEMMMICNTLNLDIRNIIKLAETKPYGFHPFSPGIGVGGHCIPVDPVFLNKLLFDKFGIKSKSIEVALEINNSVTSYAVEKVFDLVGRGVIHCRILVIGVTYKKNINDWRESPSVKLIEKLQSQLGYYVDFYDSYVSTIHLEKQEKYSIDKLSEKKLKEYDLVILAQNHSDLPLDLILSHSRKILDCTGELPLSNKVCRL